MKLNSITDFPDVDRYVNFMTWLERMNNKYVDELKADNKRYYTLFRTKFENKI